MPNAEDISKSVFDSLQVILGAPARLVVGTIQPAINAIQSRQNVRRLLAQKAEEGDVDWLASEAGKQMALDAGSKDEYEAGLVYARDRRLGRAVKQFQSILFGENAPAEGAEGPPNLSEGQKLLDLTQGGRPIDKGPTPETMDVLIPGLGKYAGTREEQGMIAGREELERLGKEQLQAKSDAAALQRTNISAGATKYAADKGVEKAKITAGSKYIPGSTVINGKQQDVYFHPVPGTDTLAMYTDPNGQPVGVVNKGSYTEVYDKDGNPIFRMGSGGPGLLGITSQQAHEDIATIDQGELLQNGLAELSKLVTPETVGPRGRLNELMASASAIFSPEQYEQDANYFQNIIEQSDLPPAERRRLLRELPKGGYAGGPALVKAKSTGLAFALALIYNGRGRITEQDYKKALDQLGTIGNATDYAKAQQLIASLSIDVQEKMQKAQERMNRADAFARTRQLPGTAATASSEEPPADEGDYIELSNGTRIKKYK